jgi:hypothetical protein
MVYCRDKGRDDEVHAVMLAGEGSSARNSQKMKSRQFARAGRPIAPTPRA